MRGIGKTRDSQKQKVYAWEKVAWPFYSTDRMLTKEQVIRLVARVHQDVIDAGGFAAKPQFIQVQFTKRNGGCARFGWLNFSPKWMPLRHVLHEIAHSLTSFYYNFSVDQIGTPMEHREVIDMEGHGPNFTACLIALCAKYAGDDIMRPLETAKKFNMMKQGRVVWESASHAQADGRRYQIGTRAPVVTTERVQVNQKMLNYWLRLLSNA